MKKGCLSKGVMVCRKWGKKCSWFIEYGGGIGACAQ